MPTFLRKARFVAAMVLLASTVVIPSGGQAQEARKVQPYLNEALRLYNELDYEQALEQLAQGRSVSEGAADDVSLSLYEGLILAELGRTEASTAAFTAALTLHPEAALPVLVSPKVQQRLEEVRQQVKQQHAQTASPPEKAPPSRVAVEPPLPTVANIGSPAREARATSSRRVWVPTAIGGGLLAGGGIAYLLARGELSKLKGSGSDFGTPEDVKSTSSRG
ncbi:tetratricopeptide repeat protein, partial [Corallococcus sp. CA053C]|uniref:tetratricopeptide repeat protein n=1 Tax=Corallococcus sp. CA053C TaxID=2316732 RepID=UPI000EE0E517